MKLQIAVSQYRHHSYFSKDFQMFLAVKEGDIQPSPFALGQTQQQQSKISKDVNEYLNQYSNIRVGIQIIFEYSMVNGIIFSHCNT